MAHMLGSERFTPHMSVWNHTDHLLNSYITRTSMCSIFRPFTSINDPKVSSALHTCTHSIRLLDNAMNLMEQALAGMFTLSHHVMTLVINECVCLCFSPPVFVCYTD